VSSCIQENPRPDYGYAAWWVEDGEEGAVVGQDGLTSLPGMRARLASAEDVSDREYWTVEIAAKEFCEGRGSETRCEPYKDGWVLESKADFRRFLTHVRAALKMARDPKLNKKPLPEWAKTALQAGWKPPKGWRP